MALEKSVSHQATKTEFIILESNNINFIVFIQLVVVVVGGEVGGRGRDWLVCTCSTVYTSVEVRGCFLGVSLFSRLSKKS